MANFKPIKTVETNDCDEFERECAKLMAQGYELSSSFCGFVNSAEYDFCSSWQAIFVYGPGDQPVRKAF